MFSELTNVVPSFFGMLNQEPMTLTLILHTIIVIPMYFIYKNEKSHLGLK